ncbi:hypothetical protein glysoja_042376 [Glycine soja]|uniref:Uncharacterized protein n=1 Tax=Glycine soja TaxID=3848 RepID=A0A0B2S674_GLYSO|nr:hypothetical protein glysoja_042376 [Glycine soja]
MEDILSGMLRHRKLLSNQLKRLSEYVEVMQLGIIHPPPINFDFYGGEHFNDSCYLYSMENYWWEQELHPYDQYEEERLSNLENVGKVAKEVAKIPFLVTREENFEEVKVHEEGLVEEHDSRERDEEKGEERTQQQWEKNSQVKIQQENILQVNIPPHQLIERHVECDKSLSVILSLNINTSLAMVWKRLLEYMSFMESLAKKQKCKEDVFYVIFMPP